MKHTNQTATFLFADDSAARVSFVLDDVSIPPSTQSLKHVQFGVATVTRGKQIGNSTRSNKQQTGILGIGYGKGKGTNYKNFIDELADQGITNSKAYSIMLGQANSRTGAGAIIFGGIDKAKYFGALAKLPIIPADNSSKSVREIFVEMQSIQHISSTGQMTPLQSAPSPVLLDTGTTVNIFPGKVADSLARQFGSTQTNRDGTYKVSCNVDTRNQTLAFNFGTSSVRIPFQDMIMKNGNHGTCILGHISGDNVGIKQTILGDTFLRSAYGMFFFFLPLP